MTYYLHIIIIEEEKNLTLKNNFIGVNNNKVKDIIQTEESEEPEIKVISKTKVTKEVQEIKPIKESTTGMILPSFIQPEINDDKNAKKIEKKDQNVLQQAFGQLDNIIYNDKAFEKKFLEVAILPKNKNRGMSAFLNIEEDMVGTNAQVNIEEMNADNANAKEQEIDIDDLNVIVEKFDIKKSLADCFEEIDYDERGSISTLELAKLLDKTYSKSYKKYITSLIALITPEKTKRIDYSILIDLLYDYSFKENVKNIIQIYNII